jgi:hypothetical protein
MHRGNRQEEEGGGARSGVGGQEREAKWEKKKTLLYDLWKLTFMLPKAYCERPRGERHRLAGEFFARRLRGCAGARQ